MEMKRNKRAANPASDLEEVILGGGRAKMIGGGGGGRVSVCLLVGILVGSLLAMSAMVFLVPGVGLPSQGEIVAAIEDRVRIGRRNDSDGGIFTSSTNIMGERFLGGLLTAGEEDESCLSKYQSALYWKESKHKPSSYLKDRLRKYEALHQRCAPYTELYYKAIHQLKSDKHMENTECKYVVWISYSGLGNRMLSLTSAFLYALLTERVLLIDRGADMVDLFCEPFPAGTWMLPLDFPLNDFSSFDQKSPQSYGNMMKSKVLDNNVHPTSQSLPAYVYVHLSHDYDQEDKLFFCEQDQLLLQKFSWMVMRSNNYFVPSLFLIPAFEEELHQLFPKKDTVFHHLGRYLFHPTNSIWGLVTRYYQTYLAKADERIGIQIRVFDEGVGPFQYVVDQVFSCISKEKLLPDVDLEQQIASRFSGKSIAVLLTSLSSGYHEKLRNFYWEHPTVNGEVVSIHQPSHEEYQQTEKNLHNKKALAEMYLLSLTDVLITSSWSTFGYVAQGLGGVKPWILSKPINNTLPEPHCSRAISMEPCFHAPPLYDCKAKSGVDTGALVPHVRHCEDMSWGLKVVDHNE